MPKGFETISYDGLVPESDEKVAGKQMISARMFANRISSNAVDFSAACTNLHQFFIFLQVVDISLACKARASKSMTCAGSFFISAGLIRESFFAIWLNFCNSTSKIYGKTIL